MKIDEILINDEYKGLVAVKYGKSKSAYSVYVNPQRQEIKDLAKDSNVARFIAFDGKVYVFPGSLLHEKAITSISDLEPLSKYSNDTERVPIEQAFLGVANVNMNGELHFSGTNQRIANNQHDFVRENYAYITRYIKIGF